VSRPMEQVHWGLAKVRVRLPFRLTAHGSIGSRFPYSSSASWTRYREGRAATDSGVWTNLRPRLDLLNGLSVPYVWRVCSQISPMETADKRWWPTSGFSFGGELLYSDSLEDLLWR
jgi:hypothetical protein